jgi:putative DNA primase/helicase
MNNVVENHAFKPSDNWPSLISIDNEELPEVPLDTLPSWAGEFAVALTDSMEIPRELAINNILACCSTASARTFRVRINQDHIEPTNLWLLTALESGARKSGALKAAKKPLAEWQRAQEEEIIPLRDKARLDHEFQNAVIKKLTNKAGSPDKEQRENLKAEIDSLVKELPLIPTIPRLYTDDCTPEHLGTLMQENNEALAWLSSEGNLFDILAGQYSSGNANIDIFLKSHAGEDVNVDRGSREPVRLYEPKLTICLNPQPDLLIGTIAKNRKILNSGLLFRFLYFWPQSTLGSRTRHSRPVAQQITDNYHAGLTAIINQTLTVNDNGEPILRILELSQEAKESLHKFALATERLMKPDALLYQFKGWASKASDAAGRVAAVLHCIEFAHGNPSEHAIRDETILKAIGFVSVSVKHTLCAFRVMGGDQETNAAVSLWDWIRRHKQKQFTVREAQQSLKRRIIFSRVKDIKSALDILAERGYIKNIVQDNNQSGKPSSPLILVRPELCEDW